MAAVAPSALPAIGATDNSEAGAGCIASRALVTMHPTSTVRTVSVLIGEAPLVLSTGLITNCVSCVKVAAAVYLGRTRTKRETFKNPDNHSLTEHKGTVVACGVCGVSAHREQHEVMCI